MVDIPLYDSDDPAVDVVSDTLTKMFDLKE